MHFDLCYSFFKYIRIQKCVNGEIKKDKLSKIKYKIKYLLLTKLKLVMEIQNNKDTFYILFLKDIKDNKKRVKIIENKLLKLKNLDRRRVILSNELFKVLKESSNSKIKEIINKNKKDKQIYKKEIYEIVNQILSKHDKLYKNENIFFLLNSYCYNDEILIEKFSKTFKCLTIVTSNIKEFKSVENKLFEKEEISIVVTNNKNKALKKAKYIINIDLTEKQLNQYKLKRDSIIFNVSSNEIKHIPGFDGVVINNVELDDKYDGKGKYYLYSRFKNYNYYINNKIIVKRIIGNNIILPSII